MRRTNISTMVVCGLAAFGLSVPAVAKDIAFNPGEPVRFEATVNDVREVPAGNPLPGIHVDAKINGRVEDIYLAPADFAAKYGVKVTKGQYISITGTVKDGDAGTVLGREITTGNYDPAHNIFRPTMTIYLRNDSGPLW